MNTRKRYGSWAYDLPEIHPRILETLSLDHLELSVRAFNILKAAEIETLEDLIGTTERQLFGLRNCGRKTVAEIIERLGRYGLRLGVMPNPIKIVAAAGMLMEEARAIQEEIEQSKHRITRLRFIRLISVGMDRRLEELGCGLP